MRRAEGEGSGGFGVLGGVSAQRALAVIAAAAICLTAAGLHVQRAEAAGTIESFTVAPSTVQAGGHPDLEASFTLGNEGGAEAAKTLRLNAPEGLDVLPHAVALCSAADFGAGECPVNSQVGLVTVRGEHEADPEYLLGTAPVYELVPEGGEFGRLGFAMPTLGTQVTIGVSVRSASDYGVRLTMSGLPEASPLASASLTLWGVPAEAGHDGDRFPKGSSGCPGLADASCNTPVSSSLPPTPFLVNPTSCDGLFSATLDLQTYGDPEHEAHAEASLPGITGCEHLAFNPSLSIEPTTEEALSLSGLDLDLTVPQPQSTSVPTPSAVEAAAVYFVGGLEQGEGPEGGVCPLSAAAIGVEGPPSCPGGTEVGTVSFDVEGMTAAPLEGGAYFGGEGPEGEYLVYLLASGHGLDLKLPLWLETEAESEELVAYFPYLPQIPIDELELHLEASSGLLETERFCGSYPVESFAAPWDRSLGEMSILGHFDLTSGPGGTACLLPAASVGVSLTPSRIAADGSSTTTATARVSDENGTPVAGDRVEFKSSDPGERIGPVVDHGDGSYSTQIVASTSVGSARIRATDLSVSPNVFGAATLSQYAPPGPPSTPIGAPQRSGGEAVAARTARVKGDSALLRLRCRGKSRCRGVLRLTLGRTTIGRARFAIAAGGSKLVRVKLDRAGRRRLLRAHGHRLGARLSGRGVRARTVVLRR